MYNIGERINHKVLGEGTVIESYEVKLPASNDTTNYIIVEFDVPKLTSSDEWKNGGVAQKQRRFSAASIKPYLI